MSDTPKTDAMMTALLWRTGEVLQADVEFANFARDLERENARLREQIAALGEIACLNLDDSTVAKCDAITGGEKYRDVMRRLFVEQPKELAALRNKVAGLEHRSQWQCSCGGTDCEGMKENVELRRLLREAITSLVRHRVALAKEAKP